jgi:hypothetical protein
VEVLLLLVADGVMEQLAVLLLVLVKQSKAEA